MTYPQAIDAIKTLIADRKLQPGMMLPSAQLLAKQFGCYRKTVNRACLELIHKGVLVRTGYKLFVGAGTPSSTLVEGIVHVLSYWDGFLKFAGRILTEHGVNYRAVQLSPSKHINPRPVLRRAFAQKPAGILLWMPFWIEGLESEFESEKIPVVICADGVPPEVGLHVVGTDYYRGTEKALKHLHELGHRHIAHVAPAITLATDRLIANSYRSTCMELGLKSSALNIWQAGTGDKAAIGTMIREQHKKHQEVTALIARGGIAEIARQIFQVPKKLSVIGIADASSTAVQLRKSDDTIALWACTNLISQFQTLQSGRPAKPAHQALFLPGLIERGSTRALKRTESDAEAKDGNHPSEPPRSVSSWDSWRRIYPLLNRSLSHKWRQFDLSKLANHSMTHEHGWLGDVPLLHFPPGLRTIHGVPFRVIDENRNGGRAVVTFRSPQTHSTQGKKLPQKVKLPVSSRVKALYVLHGCGFAKQVPFAKYIMHFRNGKTSVIPLLALGPSSQSARKQPGRLKPNIQDWWPLSKPLNFPHAMHATVFNPADPTEYERYLYTLEWINPRPKEEISHIEVRVDSEAGPTLALIAATALL